MSASLARDGKMEGMMTWQPIETAPKDGTDIVLFGHCRPRNSAHRYARDANIGWWSPDIKAWQTRVGGEVCDATHWMPLPEPPAPRTAA